MKLLISTVAPSSVALIRLMVAFVFFTEGLQKFLTPADFGSGFFATIGMPLPEILAPFMGIVELAAALLITFGLLTRWASIVLLIDLGIMIFVTKIPLLLQHDFWPAMQKSQIDFSMLMGLLFLFINGAGSFSCDAVMDNKQ